MIKQLTTYFIAAYELENKVNPDFYFYLIFTTVEAILLN